MKLFEPFVLQWWQVGIFKVGLIAFGVAAGAYCSTFFADYIGALLAIAVVSFAYMGYLRFRG